MPLADPLVCEYVQAYQQVANAAQQFRPGLLRLVNTLKAWSKPAEGDVWWIPTRAYQLLALLHERFPQHRLVFSDFDLITNATRGKWAPTVLRGGAASFTDYLQAPFGTVDMVFPTDFAMLAAMWKRRTGRQRVSLHTPEDFLSRYADVKATRLRDGYNPLLLDYANTQFLLTDLESS